MADDMTNADDPARTRINLQDDAGLGDWAKKFDVTPEQIRDAVGAVGAQAADVEMHLKGTRSTTNADQEAHGEAAADRSS